MRGAWGRWRGAAGAGPLVAGRAASAAAGILVPVVLARLLAPAAYGTFKQLFLIATTGIGLVQLGMSQSLYYFLPREPSRARTYLAHATLYLTAAGVAVTAALWAGGPLLARWMNNPALAHCAVPAALYAGFFTAAVPLEHGLIARGRIGQGGLAYVISESLRVAVQLGAARLVGTVEAILWASAAFSAVRTVAAWALNLGADGGPAWDGSIWRAQWRYCLPFGGAALLMIPQQSFHQYAVSAFAGPAQYAVYAVGCLQLPIVELLYTPISDLMILRIGNAEREGRAGQARDSFRDAVANLSWVFFPAAAALWALAPSAIPLVFTSRYAAAVPLFRISVVSLALASFPVDGVLRARARTGFFFWAQVAKLALTAVLVLGGLRLLSLRGAVLGQVAAQAVVAAAMLWESGRALGTSLVELVPWRRLAANGLPAAAAAVLVATTRSHLGAGRLAQCVLGGGLFTAVWGAGALAAWAARNVASLRSRAVAAAAGGATQIRTGE
ncbi:MAG TPA: oligosaccharide flippase family protein [Myxococcales bacterium]|nr:oligosaccharide flippase family protein [Myxococcales bacterium]